jgi:hypothetical protein
MTPSSRDRYELVGRDYFAELDVQKAIALIRSHNGSNPRLAYRDMTTWYGTNQPKVVAFTVRNDRDARRIEDAYAQATGHRCLVEPRRVRS